MFGILTCDKTMDATKTTNVTKIARDNDRSLKLMTANAAKKARKKKRAIKKLNASYLAWLPNDMMSLLAKQLNIRSVQRLMKTCTYLFYHPILRKIIGSVKPKMVKMLENKKWYIKKRKMKKKKRLGI